MILPLVVVLLAPQADREAEMFGAPPDDREAAMFGGDETPAAPPVEQRLLEAHDKLAIGGTMYLRLEYALQDADDPETHPLRSPNLLDVYLDGRPTDRLRAYTQARLAHDFTTSETGVDLDQLWLKFDVERALFVTAGQQRVKWGVGRFWNPTDFLNRQRRDPLDVFDQRLGVPLLKLHLPIESLGWNLYAVGTFDDARGPRDVGGALRAEIVAGTSEMSVSGAFRREQPLRLGADVSAGVWDLDLRLEAAVSHGGDAHAWSGDYDVLPALGAASTTGEERAQIEAAAEAFGWTLSPTREAREDDWIPQVVAGVEWGIRVGDEDTVYLTLEYLWNDAGTDDERLYPWLQAAGDFDPLYLGRQYAAAGLLVPSPGGWDNTTFSLGAIANLSDESALLRLDYSVTVLTWLRINAFVAGHLGEGELAYTLEAEGILDAAPPETDPELADVLVNGLKVPKTLIDVGVWLSVAI